MIDGVSPERFTESVRRGARLPSRPGPSSAGSGWGGMLAEVFTDPPEVEAFSTAPTGDLLLLYQLSGTAVLESRRERSWRRARVRPWSLAATAPGRVSTLRWRTAGPQPLTTLHLHVGRDLLAETAEALGPRDGERALQALPDEIGLDDPFLTGAGRAVHAALLRGAPALYADALATAVAAHVVHTTLPAGRTSAPRAGGLHEHQLAAVVDHMHAHLDADVRLEDLAALVHLSTFHFVRAFRARTGTTPHRHLVELRLDRAAELLRRTDLPVRQVARRCGWASPAQFAAAFRRRHRVSPTAYRAGSRA